MGWLSSSRMSVGDGPNRQNILVTAILLISEYFLRVHLKCAHALIIIVITTHTHHRASSSSSSSRASLSHSLLRAPHTDTGTRLHALALLQLNYLNIWTLPLAVKKAFPSNGITSALFSQAIRPKARVNW
jgi:hypothetical protein